MSPLLVGVIPINSLSVALSLSLCLSPYLSLRLYLSLSLCVSRSLSLSLSLCVSLSLSVPLCLSLSVHLPIPLSLSLSLSPSVSVCLSPLICVYLRPPPSLSLCLPLSLYLSLSLPPSVMFSRLTESHFIECPHNDVCVMDPPRLRVPSAPDGESRSGRPILREQSCVCEGGPCEPGARCLGQQCFSSLRLIDGSAVQRKGCLRDDVEGRARCATPPSPLQVIRCCQGHLCNRNVSVQHSGRGEPSRAAPSHASHRR